MLFTLPELVLSKIIEFLSVRDLCSLELVNSFLFRNRDFKDRIWSERVLNDFNNCYNDNSKESVIPKILYKEMFLRYHCDMKLRRDILKNEGINMEYNRNMEVCQLKSSYKKAVEKCVFHKKRQHHIAILYTLFSGMENYGVVNVGTSYNIFEKLSSDESLSVLKECYIECLGPYEDQCPEPFKSLIKRLNQVDDQLLQMSDFKIPGLDNS